MLQAGKHNTGKDFSHDAKERYAAVVIAVTAVSLVLVECSDASIAHLLGNVTLFSAEAQELMKMLH